MKKVVIYSRVSTKDQFLSNQIDILTEKCKKENWEIIDIVSDISSGGKPSEDRKGLRQVFKLAEQKKFNLLLFWSTDRLSREGARQTLTYLDTLHKAGVDFFSYTESYLSTMGLFRDCVISLLSILAKQERINCSERTKLGLQRARKAGKRLGRKPVDPALVEQAKAFRASGMPYSAIADKIGNITKGRAWQLVHWYD